MARARTTRAALLAVVGALGTLGMFAAGPASSPGRAGAQSRPASSSAAPRAFTSAERRTLESGGLVVRRRSERRGGQVLVGGTSWQVIALPADALWRALLDTARYPKMLPACTAARTLSSRGDRRTVALEHEVGPIRAHYALSARVDAARRDLTFALDPSRPHSVRAAWGFFTVRPQGDARSLLSYGLMADFGDGLFGGLLRPRLHDWSLRAPSIVKAFVEGEGRARYLPVGPRREVFVAGREAPGARDFAAAPEAPSRLAERGPDEVFAARPGDGVTGVLAAGSPAVR